jgi:hypothetical protein
MANEEMLRYADEHSGKKIDYTVDFEQLNERQNFLHEQLAKQQKLIHKQEIELNDNQNRIKEEQIIREKKYSQEFREREAVFENREKDLVKRKRQIDQQLNLRVIETDRLQSILKKEITEKEKLLSLANEELEIQKARYTEESRKQIESKSQKYVSTALIGLQSKENDFHFMAKAWAVVGAIAITLGIGFIIFSTFYGADGFHKASSFSWSYFLFITFRGLIVVAMFIALAKYSYVYSNSYMHESLKSGERRHAINFGKFYLEAYGNNANWEQVKEAFQHWNISNESAFSKKKTSDFDPKLMETAMEISKVLSKTVKDKAAPTQEKA